MTDRVIYEIATSPDLLGLLRPILGKEIVLWGARLVVREPGTIHPWHTDVESAAPDARVASVWIGIQNACRETGMVFVAGSQHFGRSVQEVLSDLGERREDITDERLLAISRSIDPAATLCQPDVRDGCALLFDGRVWHSGRHGNASPARIALLLQYAAADYRIRMPVDGSYLWPFRFETGRTVPTILVSGSGRGSVNRLVPPPPQPMDRPAVTIFARTVALPLAEDAVTRWRPYHQFGGPTSTLAAMSCHISVLSAGHAPHCPHIHEEEEVLVLLEGAVEVELADDPDRANSKRYPMRPGMFSYYPATQHHTIHNTGAGPATYLMFKWRGAATGSEAPLAASVFDYERTAAPGQPQAMTLLFEQATDQLPKLHAHLTTLQPGAGYEPHADPYDVAILLLSGEVETLGKRLGPLGVIYYAAGELHGMRNTGTTPATYLVFEFHSPSTLALHWREAQATRQARLAEKQRRKRGLRGLLRKLVKTARKRLR